MKRLYPILFMLLFSMTVMAQNTVNPCPDDKHPHAIDMGLPSGTKWACCNTGASSPEGYGGYFLWGDLRNIDEHFSWRQYSEPLPSGGYRQLGEDIAGSEHDVARYRWGSPWRMPSHTQFIELLNFCTMTSTTHKGVKGTLLTSPNGNSIFLPFAGCRWDVNLMGIEKFGCYWTSTLRVYGEGRACAIDLYPDRWELGDGIRNNALTVRPVRP